MKTFYIYLLIAFVFILPSTSHAAAAETEKERHDKLVEAAKKEGSVVFYGSITASESETIRKVFESKYPFLKITQFRAGSDSLLQKVLTETRAGRREADVFNIRSFEGNVLVERGLFAKYASPHSKFYRDDFKDREGHWTSFYMNPATIGYNTKLVPRAEAPKDWFDLLDPKWKGQMVMDREETEWFANMLKFMGRDKGLQYMRRLATQDLTFRAGHSLMAQLVAAGEFKLGTVLYTPRMEVMKKSGAPIEWVRANPVIAYHYVVGVAAHAPHPNAARLFVDFLLSKEGQELLVKTSRVPVRSDVKAEPPTLVEGVNLMASDISLAPDYRKYYDEYRQVFKVQ